MVKIDIVMPTYCYDCPCHDGENGKCNITRAYVFDKRPFDCPLREDKSTTDGEEVKHGVIQKVYRGGNPLWDEATVCSLCLHTVWDHFNYCPNCGAKLDGKESGDET